LPGNEKRFDGGFREYQLALKFINLMKRIISFSIFAVLSASLLAQVDIKIKLNDIRGGKPPLKFYNSDVTINNKTEKPYWVVFPNYVEDSLKRNGIFEAEKLWEATYIEGKGYSGKTSSGNAGKMTEIDFLGKYGHSFRALLIPAKSSLFIKNFSFESSIETDSMDVGVTEALLVNDSIALEKFLPYRIITDKNLRVDANLDWDNLNYDRETFSERSDLPKSPVRFIHAIAMKVYRKAVKKP
jgi:hypothetical protein